MTSWLPLFLSNQPNYQFRGAFCNEYKLKQWIVTTAQTNDDIFNVYKNYKHWDQWCVLIIEIPHAITINQLINKQQMKFENNKNNNNNNNNNGNEYNDNDNDNNNTHNQQQTQINDNVKFFNQITSNIDKDHFIFISIDSQINKLNYEISNYLYSFDFLQIYQKNPNEMLFKNIGYMFAIKHNAHIIFDTDRFHFVKGYFIVGFYFFIDLFFVLFLFLFVHKNCTCFMEKQNSQFRNSKKKPKKKQKKMQIFGAINKLTKYIHITDTKTKKQGNDLKYTNCKKKRHEYLYLGNAKYESLETQISEKNNNNLNSQSQCKHQPFQYFNPFHIFYNVLNQSYNDNMNRGDYFFQLQTNDIDNDIDINKNQANKSDNTINHLFWQNPLLTDSQFLCYQTPIQSLLIHNPLFHRDNTNYSLKNYIAPEFQSQTGII